jgi:hypothetical protein
MTPEEQLTPDQRKFVAWARQHLKDWRERDAQMLRECRERQTRGECRQCIALWACLFGNEGQPCAELSGPRPLQMPAHWPEVQRNLPAKRPRK